MPRDPRIIAMEIGQATREAMFQDAEQRLASTSKPEVDGGPGSCNECGVPIVNGAAQCPRGGGRSCWVAQQPDAHGVQPTGGDLSGGSSDKTFYAKLRLPKAEPCGSGGWCFNCGVTHDGPHPAATRVQPTGGAA